MYDIPALIIRIAILDIKLIIVHVVRSSTGTQLLLHRLQTQVPIPQMLLSDFVRLQRVLVLAGRRSIVDVRSLIYIRIVVFNLKLPRSCLFDVLSRAVHLTLSIDHAASNLVKLRCVGVLLLIFVQLKDLGQLLLSDIRPVSERGLRALLWELVGFGHDFKLLDLVPF